MSAHGAARGLIGEHTVSVILNVGYVVECAEQRAGVQNRNYAVRTVGPTVLYNAGFDGGDVAVVLHAGLQIDDGPGTSAMCPEDFLTRVGNLDRSLRLARCDRRDDLDGNDFALPAESSAHERLDHANLRHWHLKHERQLVLQVIWHLRRGPYRQAPRLAGARIDFESRQRGVRLHRSMRDF